MKKKLPPIPRSIMLPAGRIPVSRKSHDAEEIMGLFDWHERKIYIRKSLSDLPAWLTLRHERVHAVLMDAGINIPDETLLERICDAMAAADVYDMTHPLKRRATD